MRGHWITDVTNTLYYGNYHIDAPISRTDPSTILNTPESYFDVYKSMSNENTRGFLDGHGRPANAILNVGGETAGPPASAICKYYKESNFLLLGIPTSFS